MADWAQGKFEAPWLCRHYDDVGGVIVSVLNFNSQYGHRNWMDAEFTGNLNWDEWSAGLAYDDDYNIYISPMPDKDTKCETCDLSKGPCSPGCIAPERSAAVKAGSATGTCIPNCGDAEVVPGGIAQNRKNTKLEFDSDETIDQFTSGGMDDSAHKTWWWRGFQMSVEKASSHFTGGTSDDAPKSTNGNWLTPNDLLGRPKDETGYPRTPDGSYAIAIGLVNNDEEHPSGNEVHPTHAFAARVPALYTPQPVPSGMVMEHWAFFARNWGNEGCCSSEQHLLLETDLSLRLPARDEGKLSAYKCKTNSAYCPVVRAFNTRTANAASAVVSYAFDYNPTSSGHEGLLLYFPLGDPNSQAWFAGELEVLWPTDDTTIAGKGMALDYTKPASLPPADGNRVQTELDDANPAMSELTPEQLTAFNQIYGQLKAPPTANFITATDATAQALPAVRPRRRVSPSVSTGPARPHDAQNGAALVLALCAATDGHPPYAPDLACADLAPVTVVTESQTIQGLDPNCAYAPYSITLKARNTSGTGVLRTEYSHDSLNWITYVRPIQAAAGETIYYRSVGNNGSMSPILSYVVGKQSNMKSVLAYGVLAGSTLDIRDGQILRDSVSGLPAPVADVGTGGVQIGVKASVGNVVSYGDVTLRNGAAVNGDVNLLGSISPSNAPGVTGSVIKSVPTIQSVAACAGSIPSTLPTNSGISLEPGQTYGGLRPNIHYANVIVKQGASISLSAGTYYIDNLDLEPNSGVACDESAGPVILVVGNTLTVRGLFVTVNGSSPRPFILYYGQQMVNLINYPFLGTIVAPSAMVDVASGGTWEQSGTFIAQNLLIEPWGTLHVSLLGNWPQ